MKPPKKIIKIFLFLIGFMLGLSIHSNLFGNSALNKDFILKRVSTSFNNSSIHKKADTSLAEKLFNEIRIVCLVLTQPADHQKKAKYVKNTWGSKCNRLIFLSTVNDTDLGAMAFPFNESREILWGKVRRGFLHAYENYYDEADWFLKADDDS